MKPFKPKQRMSKRKLLKRRIFAVIVMILLAFAWYSVADEVDVNKNENQTMEGR